MKCCQRHDLIEIRENKTAENHPPGPALSHLGHSFLVIAVVAAFDNHDSNAERTSRREHCGCLLLVCKKISGAREKSNLVGLRDHFQEEVEPLASQFTVECGDAGNVSPRPVESSNHTVFHGITTVEENDR